MSNKQSKTMLVRTFIIMIIVVAFTIVSTTYALVKIAIIRGEKYQNAALEQQLYDTQLSAPRGDIYDKNMNVLATSAPAWNVYVNPNGIATIKENKEEVEKAIIDGLSEILSVDRQVIINALGQNYYYVIVKRQVDKEIFDKVHKFLDDNKKLGLTNYVGLEETTKRYYPNDNLASVVLGFVGNDNTGLSGIESYYDSVLLGTPGRTVAAKSAKGVNMPQTYERIEEAVKGNSLVLTIDNYIQYIAEKYLEEGVEANAAQNKGACIVMDVNTGGILAMAIKGDFDPNEPFEISAADKAKADEIENEDERSKMIVEFRNRQWRNKAVSDTYEPGSVFKVITGSMALEENLVNLNSTFTCAGHITVAG
ncbi:MAG: stage V sporulation protein D, partial [Clostridiales bacterium]|nr:stage V sporulation protein D [Candidatus Equinaster intestinalis]